MLSPVADLVFRLLTEVADPLGVPHRPVPADDVAIEVDWARSGARQLTGCPDGPPLPAPGAPATAARAALAVASAYSSAALPGVEVLGERAALMVRGRNAPFSVGGAFRAIPARDGWFGLSLSRAADLELLPVLIQADVLDDPWRAVSAWAVRQPVAEVVARTGLLSLAAAAIPARTPTERRPPVAVAPGGHRRRVGRPRVIDLTSLWAGPLCARLLGLAGADVVKVESTTRPDGARLGPPGFFDRLHAGHRFEVVDFLTEQDRLHALIAEADVVLEASRPRALRQLGIEATDFVARGAIWVSITAYGRAPDDEMRIGFGDDVAAGAGLITWVGDVPIPVGDAIADPLAGAHAAAAALIALAGERGALLDVSMHDVAVRAASAS